MKDIKLDLWKRYQRGDQQAREELILYYLPLVRFWANKISRMAPWANRDDLMQEGIAGLIKAVERFDPDRGSEFSIYARNYIRGAIFESSELTRNLTRNQNENYRKVKKAHYKLMEKLKRRPTIEEIAQESELSIEQIEYALNAMSIAFTEESSDSIKLVLQGSRNGFERLQELLQSGELSNRLGVEVEGIQWTDPQQQDRGILTQEALSRLNEREQIVLSEHYWAGQSDQEIANKHKLKVEMVKKIRMRAIKKLRTLLE